MASVLERLSSARGEPGNTANKAVASAALEHPEILDEVAAGLQGEDRRLVADCAEVLTEVAKEKPALAAPYAGDLIPLLGHRDSRVRWEATHAVALVAALVPELIAPIVPELAASIANDRSVIVRDSAVIAVGEFGRSGPGAARTAFPVLQRSLELWQGKHAKLALEGMGKLLEAEPDLRLEVQAAAQSCLDHPRASVRQVARRLLRG